MAVRLQVNSYVSKFIELWHLGYDAQLNITCVDGHLGINMQQSLHHRENASPRYSRDEYNGCKTPTQPHVQRQRQHERPQQHPLPREQPARRRRRQKRASAREMVGDGAAQIPASHHQLPLQPDATSHAPPAADQAAAPYFLPPLLPPAEQVGEQQHLSGLQPTEEVSQNLQVEINSPIPLYVWHSRRPPKRPKRRYPRGIIQPSSDPLNPIHAMTLELSQRVTQSPKSPHPSSPPPSPVSAPPSPSTASDLPATGGKFTTVKQLARRGGPWDVIGPEFYLMSDSEDEDLELSSHLSSLLSACLSPPPPPPKPGRVELPSQQQIANMSYEELLQFAGGYELDILEEPD